MTKRTTAFITYSWDDENHRQWVADFAARLRNDGIDVILDKWSPAPGDMLPQFMEEAIRDNDFVLIICTPRYKVKSDSRTGGVGYEGDIITAEVMAKKNNRKFIPILRRGEWNEAAPSWVLGKIYIDLSGISYSERNYHELLDTLLGRRPQAPPVGKPAITSLPQPLTQVSREERTISRAFEPIRITGVITERVGTPRNDGTRGSALYAVPFQLSRMPTAEWAELFVETWDHPPFFSTMHRPGIARVSSDQVILDGTTLGEVEKYHQETLKLVLDEVNKKVAQNEKRRSEEERQRMEMEKQHRDNIQEVAKRIKFD